MAKQVINIGTVAGDNTGDPLRTAFDKVNDNFTELYDQVTVGKKTYKALLNQTGTNAPIATVLENTIGNIVWGYTAEGIYTATLTGAFTANKTIVFGDRFLGSVTEGVFPYVLMFFQNTSTIAIQCYEGDVGSNNFLINTPISIEVYP
jgi:hypothetical protein